MLNPLTSEIIIFANADNMYSMAFVAFNDAPRPASGYALRQAGAGLQPSRSMGRIALCGVQRQVLASFIVVQTTLQTVQEAFSRL